MASFPSSAQMQGCRLWASCWVPVVTQVVLFACQGSQTRCRMSSESHCHFSTAAGCTCVAAWSTARSFNGARVQPLELTLNLL